MAGTHGWNAPAGRIPLLDPHRYERQRVRFKLRPTDKSFYEYFSRAAQNLVAGTALLAELVLPDADIQSISDRMTDLEHDSDQITHELYNKINSTFITPF